VQEWQYGDTGQQPKVKGYGVTQTGILFNIHTLHIRIKEWRKLPEEQLHNFYCPPNVI
jgi:hypothetical protein